MKSGVTIQRATSAFEVEGKHYPDRLPRHLHRAIRPTARMILDMLEPQDHPNDFAYPGAPPTRPYDATGWTLAYQMGVTFDPPLRPASLVPSRRSLPIWPSPPAGTIERRQESPSAISSRTSTTTPTPLPTASSKPSIPVYWLKQPITSAGGKPLAAGALYIPYSAAIAQNLHGDGCKDAWNQRDRPSPPSPTAKPSCCTRPASAFSTSLWRLHAVRLDSLAASSSSSSPSRSSILRCSTPGTLTRPSTTSCFADGAVAQAPARCPPHRQSAVASAATSPNPRKSQLSSVLWLGRLSAEKSLPQLQKSFVENGGTLLAIGSSTKHLHRHEAPPPPMPSPRSVQRQGAAGARPSASTFPGSLIRAQVDNTEPVAYGMPSAVDVFFDNSSPAFRATPNAATQGLQHRRLLRRGQSPGLRVGLGPDLPQQLHRRIAQANPWAKGKVLLYGPGSHVPRPTPRHLQVPLQRPPLRPRHPGDRPLAPALPGQRTQNRRPVLRAQRSQAREVGRRRH